MERGHRGTVDASGPGGGLEGFALLAGGSGALLLAGTFGAGTLQLALGFPLHGGWALLAGTCLAAGWAVCQATPRRLAVASLAATALYLAACTGLCLASVDFSFDGQTVHQVAAGALAEGTWNPWLEGPPPAGVGDVPANLAHNPKLGWVVSAAFLQAAGRLGAARLLNFLALWVAFWCCLGQFHRRGLGGPRSFLLALAVALNPVVTTQLATSYVDGLGYLLLAAALALAVDPPRGTLPVLALLVASGVNVKFSFTVYFLLLTAGLVALGAGSAQRSAVLGRAPLAGAPQAALVGLLAGVLVLGFHPFGTNLAGFGNPIYPYGAQVLKGSGSTALEIRSREAFERDTPPPLRGRSRLGQLALSLGSASGNVVTTLRPPWPFTPLLEQLRRFTVPDVRLGGFGPMFLPALLLALVLVLALRRRLPPGGGLLLGGLAGSVAAFPEAWWARYVPQLWLVPVVAVACAWGWRDRPRRVGVAAALVLSLLLLDGLLVAGVQARHQVKTTALIRANLEELRDGPPLRVDFRAFVAHRHRLEEAGIRYREVPGLRGPEVRAFPYSDALYAPGP